MTLASAHALGARRILFQCPASFTPPREHVADMRRFFASIERDEGMRLLWEPRGGWEDDLVRTLCRELGLVHVVDPFSARTQTPDECYFRLHGRGGWRYVYEDSELEELVTTLPRDSPVLCLIQQRANEGRRDEVPRTGSPEGRRKALSSGGSRASRALLGPERRGLDETRQGRA